MLFMIHAMLGALIGLHFSSALIIILIALISHFLIDIIPHWDIGSDKEYFKKFSIVKFPKRKIIAGIIDGILAIFIICTLAIKFDSNLLVLGSIAALFPDIISLGYFTKLKHTKKYHKYLQFHISIQGKAKWFFGLVTQLIAILILYLVLF